LVLQQPHIKCPTGIRLNQSITPISVAQHFMCERQAHISRDFRKRSRIIAPQNRIATPPLKGFPNFVVKRTDETFKTE